MKPILFNQEMVRAILDGRKTVTRRLVKDARGNAPEYYGRKYFYKIDENLNGNQGAHAGFYKDSDIFYMGEEKHIDAIYFKQKYKVGDILYVRETWIEADGCAGERYFYKTDETKINKQLRLSFGYKWRPSIHMPKKAARIFLKVTDVRVERLQDITEEQARAEGCIDFHDKIGNGNFDDVLEFDLTARDAFVELWNSALKKDSSDTWAHNPWVWVYEFERCEKPQEGGE